MSELRFNRWLVSAIFAGGALTGVVLTHCADPPPPNTASACQSIVWGSWVAEQRVIGPRAPVLVSSARELVRDIRRCNGWGTQFIDDHSDHDPFGIGGASPSDAGIYRSH